MRNVHSDTCNIWFAFARAGGERSRGIGSIFVRAANVVAKCWKFF